MKKEKLKITQEIVDKVMYLDCRSDEDVRRLKKSLKRLPIIKSDEHLETDNLEKVLMKIEAKYPIHLSYIMRSYSNGEPVFTGMLKSDKNHNGEWVKTVYGQTTWEVLAKVVFYMYYYITKERDKLDKISNKIANQKRKSS